MLNKVQLDNSCKKMKYIWVQSSREELVRICRTEKRYALETIKSHRKRLKRRILDSEFTETQLNLDILLKYVEELEAMEGVFCYVPST